MVLLMRFCCQLWLISQANTKRRNDRSLTKLVGEWSLRRFVFALLNNFKVYSLYMVQEINIRVGLSSWVGWKYSTLQCNGSAFFMTVASGMLEVPGKTPLHQIILVSFSTGTASTAKYVAGTIIACAFTSVCSTWNTSATGWPLVFAMVWLQSAEGHVALAASWSLKRHMHCCTYSCHGYWWYTDDWKQAQILKLNELAHARQRLCNVSAWTYATCFDLQNLLRNFMLHLLFCQSDTHRWPAKGSCTKGNR